MREHVQWFVIVVAVVLPGAFAGVDYCSVHTFRSNSTWLQFTKEISNREYFVTGAFKSLHCCAKGYRSIEWYKDGKPYPWPGSFILYPESANQTVYSPSAQAADAGNYSCLVRNDTAHRWHHTTLSLVGETGAAPPEGWTYSGRPLLTYAPQDQVVQLGEDARFFCEAFIGSVNLPDAHSAIWWRREGVGNDSSESVGSVAALGINGGPHRGLLQKDTSREDEQILGMYLEIREVRLEDLGQYTCHIRSLDNERLQQPAWLRRAEALPRAEPGPSAPRRLLLQLAFLALAALTVVALALRFGPELRLLARDAFARPHNDGRQWDVLICYAPADTELALGVLQPALEHRLGFRCTSRALAPANPHAWCDSLAGCSEGCRRLLALLSPALLGGDWSPAAVAAALASLRAHHPGLVVVALQPLPSSDCPKDEGGRALRRETRSAPPVVWGGPAEPARRAFWTALRLRLPPRPRRAADAAADAAPGGKALATLTGSGGAASDCRPQRCGSHESLEVLV